MTMTTDCPIRFQVMHPQEYTIVSFELTTDVISPDDLTNAVLTAPRVNPRKGVVISGRGPTWLACALAHHYHATIWVALYDPRLGAVVVQDHSGVHAVGDVIPLEL